MNLKSILLGEVGHNTTFQCVMKNLRKVNYCIMLKQHPSLPYRILTSLT